ncbi:3'-5' exonuclease [Mycoemilia scoparia]|uniref:RNA exonuclease 4 n=1 Tax=Mycoemilia scoparia TaxID=417184 RepID=A0A9W8A3B5_9FUNG|nr:3'-5' exonuclease [Mycoemilia scoparia]
MDNWKKLQKKLSKSKDKLKSSSKSKSKSHSDDKKKKKSKSIDSVDTVNGDVKSDGTEVSTKSPVKAKATKKKKTSKTSQLLDAILNGGSDSEKKKRKRKSKSEDEEDPESDSEPVKSKKKQKKDKKDKKKNKKKENDGQEEDEEEGGGEEVKKDKKEKSKKRKSGDHSDDDDDDDSEKDEQKDKAKPKKQKKSTSEDEEEIDPEKAAEMAQNMALEHIAITDKTIVSDKPMPADADSWFDEIAQKDFLKAKRKLIEREGKLPSIDPAVIVPEEKRNAVGKFLAIDCEMVGVGPRGIRSMLARVSLVNYYGVTVMDEFVKPQEKVTDYRTWVSGIRPQDIANAPSFKEVQKRVADLFKDRIIIGHAIHNDLKAMLLSHPKSLIRDTSLFAPFREACGGRTPGLKKLADLELGLKIQGGEHSSVIDAKITMLLYRKVRARWEKSITLSQRTKEKRKERAIAKALKRLDDRKAAKEAKRAGKSASAS